MRGPRFTLCSMHFACGALFLLSGLLTFTGCDLRSTGSENWVVRVQDHYLTTDELNEIIPPGTTEEDSAKIADNYINKWLKDQVVLVQAELNLPPELTDFEQQLRDYRNSLVVYTFERELIQQKLDTVITDREVEEYYENHKDNFALKDYIVRVNFIKLPANAPKVAQVEEWILSGSYEDLEMLDDYSRQFAEFGFFDDQRWIYFDDLIRQIPIRVTDKDQFLSQNKLVKLNEGDYLYILKIVDYQLKNGTSPLAFVEKDIRNIIINKRKREFILEMRKDLLENAHENNEIEYNN